MTPGAHTERAFEDRVEHELLEQGWEQAQGTYRPDLALDTGELVRFIGATQQKKWDKLIELYGGDQPTAQRQFAQRLASEIDARGVLDVLRQGVKDKGVAFDLAYFRPGHTLAAAALHDYHANVLTVARQLHYSARDAKKSVDRAPLVNGLPVVTVDQETRHDRRKWCQSDKSVAVAPLLTIMTRTVPAHGELTSKVSVMTMRLAVPRPSSATIRRSP